MGLREAELSVQADVVADDRVAMMTLLADILPAAAKTGEERTPEDKAALLPWYDKVKWFMALRRVGYEPPGGDAAPTSKRARLSE